MVDRYPLESDFRCLPEGTWALSDSCGKSEQPCDVFLTAATVGNAWVVQTTSPSEKRYKEWKKQYSADIFYMDYFSIAEITALRLV
jgi:hypothetical protein